MRAVLKSIRDDLKDVVVSEPSGDLRRFIDSAKDMMKVARFVACKNTSANIGDLAENYRFAEDQVERLEVLYRLYEWGTTEPGLSEETIALICKKILRVWNITIGALIALMDTATEEYI